MRIVGFDLDVRNPEPTGGGADTVLRLLRKLTLASPADGRARADQEVREALARQLAGSGRGCWKRRCRYRLHGTGRLSGEETGEVFATAKVKERDTPLTRKKLQRRGGSSPRQTDVSQPCSYSSYHRLSHSGYRGGAGDQFLQWVAGYSRAVVSP